MSRSRGRRGPLRPVPVTAVVAAVAAVAAAVTDPEPLGNPLAERLGHPFPGQLGWSHCERPGQFLPEPVGRGSLGRGGRVRSLCRRERPGAKW